MNLNLWMKRRVKRDHERHAVHNRSTAKTEVIVIKPENQRELAENYYSSPPVDATKRRKPNAG